MMSNPKISIVIPVFNGIATIENCIKGIQKQTVYNQCEIIVIDSGSTDGTLNVLKSLNIDVISIASETFNHGATRNLGVTYAKGEFVVMTVQDAVAADELWLENMLKHFDVSEIAAVCGKQAVPHQKDKNPHEWARPQSVPVPRTVSVASETNFNELSPEEQRKLCAWDDVNAMYRKSALQNLPFQPLAYGEDMLWAKMALIEGYSLVYEPNAIVYHYHYQFPKYTYKRSLINQLFIYKCFGLVLQPSSSLRDYALIVYRNLKWNVHPKWILHNFHIKYYNNKASNTFNSYLKNNEIEKLEKELSLDVPLGKQNIKIKK
ncbi:glycosyltransferase family 2 protein [Winogradskyella helgolandensis]|uniref:glycosyltransferase family 2 protein n=1 Tax=Winogradskyella helgolandensis TaxID=2697010 RepID=UPI0015C06B6B|nr:glycosyltransferase [Winogradskyella helgolandensis]